MNAVLLIILLAHGGYWFDGENSITVKWANPAQASPEAILSWTLAYGKLAIASESVEVARGENVTAVKLQLPEARVAAEYQWKYQLKDKQTGKLLEEGTRTIRLLPRKLFGEHAKSVRGRKLVALEDADKAEKGISAVLREAGIEVLRVTAMSDLQLLDPAIVLIDQGRMPASELAQQALLAKAREGASVMVFSQNQLQRLGNFELKTRKPPTQGFAWRQPHVLFDMFDATAMDAWAKEAELKALGLPPAAAALELGAWPRETPGTKPAPIDALVVTQTLGAGRIVYWQIPVKDWKADPRGQLLLANALDYLLTRPEPTLPQADRQAERVPATLPADKNRIGAHP